MKRKNILIFSEIYKNNFFESNGYKLPIECGGSQKNLITNLEILKEHFNCYLLVRNLDGSGDWKTKGIPLIPTGSICSLELFSYILIILRLLSKKPFNISTPHSSETTVIIHNNSLLSLLIKLLKPRYKVLFFIENDWKTLFWRPYVNFFMKIVFSAFFFINLLLVDKIIKIKPDIWMLENHLSSIKNKSYYFPNVINKKIFNPKKSKELSLEQINKDNIIFLYVGRLDDYINKNPSLLFKSYEIVSKRIKDSKLIVLGTGKNHWEHLSKKYSISNCKNIIFVDSISNELTANYYRRSNLTLLTSNHEGGNPYAILESLACGTPCITTDVVNSSVIKDGINGFISKSKSPEDFAALILRGLELSLFLKPLEKDLLDNNYDLWNREKALLELVPT